MTEAAPSGDVEADAFILAGGLSPADAQEQLEELRRALAAAQSEGSGLTIDLDDSPTPCALQLLIACDRSARKSGVEVSFGERAGQALDGINLN